MDEVPLASADRAAGRSDPGNDVVGQSVDGVWANSDHLGATGIEAADFRSRDQHFLG
ncbi:hypothetical protein [Nocardia brasiliensis]|uniref:hypothetical protein n=1 Tax=Nocardia brasiliensis TaxID=37326 RepID=UPI002457021D|nr:hypothetical protein [Nocardia brasiliensis]